MIIECRGSPVTVTSHQGRAGEAGKTSLLNEAIEPLFDLMGFTTSELLDVGGESLAVPQRVRNPVPLKAAMLALGLDLGGTRPQMGWVFPMFTQARGAGVALVAAAVTEISNLVSFSCDRYFFPVSALKI